MKKLYLLVGSLSLVIIGAGAYVYATSLDKHNDNPVSSPTQSKPKTTNTPDRDAKQPNDAKPGTYVDYSNEALVASNGTKLLFFHAPWCLQCNELEKSIESSTIPDNVTIFKVDYDSNQELRKKYEVTIQTTVVKLDASNNKLESYVAYQEPTFNNVDAALLK